MEFERNFEAHEAEPCTKQQMVAAYESYKEFQSYKLDKRSQKIRVFFSHHIASLFCDVRNSEWVGFRMGGAMKWVSMKNMATKYHLEEVSASLNL